MSKSLKRVQAALEAANLPNAVLEMNGETRTAQQAADQVGCALNQIAKSIIFKGEASGQAVLFVTAGGNQVEASLATQVAGEPLARADAAFVRATTGFAIGGVSPVGHLNPAKCFFDPTLLGYQVVYAAAGTPRHLFPCPPETLMTLCNGTQADFIS